MSSSVGGLTGIDVGSAAASAGVTSAAQMLLESRASMPEEQSDTETDHDCSEAGDEAAAPVAGSSVKRRAMTQASRERLQAMVTSAVEFLTTHGHLRVERVGANYPLGDWVDKLKETYRARPGSAREQWLAAEAPALHAEINAWRLASSGKGARSARAVPAEFWKSAGQYFEVMYSTGMPPSQASEDRRVVALAKWLSRWMQPTSLYRLQTAPWRVEVIQELRRLTKSLRSKNVLVLYPARTELDAWKSHKLYGLIAAAALAESTGDAAASKGTLVAAMEEKAPFWGTLSHQENQTMRDRW